jgi:hypothetical protein
MMQFSRNDPCPCGSGNKYKKCCQDRVEEFTGRLLLEMSSGVSTTGQEIVRTLGLWCGLQLPETGAPPDPALLGRLLPESWQVKGTDAVPYELFRDLLLDKKTLQRLRIPVNLLADAKIGTDDAVDQEGLRQHIIDNLPEGFYEFASYTMALSMRSDIYLDGELKALLAGFSWALVDQKTRSVLATVVLEATLQELAKAQQEFAALDPDAPDANGTVGNEKMRRFFAGHPAYDNFISTRMLAKVDPACRAIMESGALQVPFYAIAGGCYALYLEVLEALPELSDEQLAAGLPGDKVLQVLRDALWRRDECLCFLPELQKVIADWPDGGAPAVSASMQSLKGLFNGFFMSCQFKTAETFYISCVIDLINNGPHSLPGVDAPAPSLLDLCSSGVIEPYIEHLKSQRLTDEAEHLRVEYQRWAPRIARQYASLVSAVPAGGR